MNELKIYDSDPDRLLVERATAGDMTAFDELVQQHEHLVFRTIFRITKIREDAEDQTQETFIRAYRNLGSFRGSSKFKTWLTQIAVNQALMCLRRRHSDVISCMRPTPDEDEDRFIVDLVEPGLNPEQQWARAEQANYLESEINRLPGTLRSAFILRCVHEYTSIEASIRLGISIAAVKSRVLRARKRIRERIDKSANASMRDESRIDFRQIGCRKNVIGQEQFRSGK